MTHKGPLLKLYWKQNRISQSLAILGSYRLMRYSNTIATAKGLFESL